MATRIETGLLLPALDLPLGMATTMVQDLTTATEDPHQETRGHTIGRKRESERGTGTVVGRKTTTGMLTATVGRTTAGTETTEG